MDGEVQACPLKVGKQVGSKVHNRTNHPGSKPGPRREPKTWAWPQGSYSIPSLRVTGCLAVTAVVFPGGIFLFKFITLNIWIGAQSFCPGTASASASSSQLFLCSPLDGAHSMVWDIRQRRAGWWPPL